MSPKRKPTPEDVERTQESAADTSSEQASDANTKAPRISAADLAAAQQRAETAEGKAAEAQNALLRTAAEYENFRKRSQKEHDAAFNNGVGYAVHQLLPVIDTLEAAANAESTDKEYKKGVLLTLAKTEEIFAKLGISEIEALGQPFDPELHNACMQEPCEGAECGTITRVVQKGYKLGDKVLRHSMVAVQPG